MEDNTQDQNKLNEEEREWYKIRREFELKEKELDLRREEIELRTLELRMRADNDAITRRTLRYPIMAATIGALALLLGALYNGAQQSATTREQIQAQVAQEQLKLNNQLYLEQKKFEFSVIAKAIETGDPYTAANNLRFARDIGLIDDPTGTIAALARDPASSPVLPIVSTSSNPASPSPEQQALPSGPLRGPLPALPAPSAVPVPRPSPDTAP